ncbi:MAG: cytochrome c [Chitinophagales bacterium]|nr:cytochrome c [Chitinophagales bacterium]MDW8427335.1 cytochrome c [Chitinophagales bacterium]
MSTKKVVWSEKLLRLGLIVMVVGVFPLAVWLLYRAYTGSSPVTFAEHIGPMIHQHCSGCHKPGTPAPFTLRTYSDVRKRALTIKAVIERRLMPPWPADPTYSQFCEQNVLTEEQIAQYAAWVKAGMPAGDTSRLKLPKLVAGSMIGKPDLTLRLPPIHIAGDNTDRFLLVKVPFELERDTFIRAIEFVPGSKLVHHANGRLITYADHQKKNLFAGVAVLDPQNETKHSVFLKMNLYNDDGTDPGPDQYFHSVTNYLPGVLPTIYPSGIGGFKVKRKCVLYFNDIHFGPSYEDIVDTSYVNIFFDSVPPARPTMELQLGTLGISDIIPPLVIPPDTVMTFVTRAKVLNDISLLTINPHMHLLGKSFLAYAIKPDGDTIPLIRIPQWDFQWQYFYTFRKMLHIPKNSIIEVVAVMDNTANNPNNPHHPPQQVEGRNGSMRTTDEMLQLILTFLPYQPGDEHISLMCP